MWGKNFGGTYFLFFLRGGIWASEKFRFPTIIMFLTFWIGGKNSLDYLEKKYGNID